MATSINVNRPLKSVMFDTKMSGRQIFFTICMQQADNDAHKFTRTLGRSRRHAHTHVRTHSLLPITPVFLPHLPVLCHDLNASPGLFDLPHFLLHSPPPWDHWTQPLFRFPSTHRRGYLERSFISTINATVHTNTSRTRSFSKTLFKLEESENALDLCVLR